MNSEFFQNNRRTLLNTTDAECIVIAGNSAIQSSNDASYHFEQEANFWYLTGIESANWWVLIQPHKSILVAPDVDEVHRIFDGDLSYDEAKKISGVDEVVGAVAGKALLDELLPNATVWTIGEDPHKDHYSFALNPGPVEMYVMLQDVCDDVQDCRQALAKQRAIKQPIEIELMRQAIDLTIDAFNEVKSGIATYNYEYEIEADFSHYFRSRGAVGHAYDPIVAAGKHACTLHYIKNQAPVQQGEFVLLDVGARLHGYAADITRTYAVGEVSKRHAQVHHEVEQAHQQIIGLLKPGLAVKKYAQLVDEIMKQALRNLDLLKTDSDYRKYFPHAVSHGLGIDVHDSLGAPEAFMSGMVLTVEPGIYIPEEGIGVRIEDDILITPTGCENLSEKLPTSL